MKSPPISTSPARRGAALYGMVMIVGLIVALLGLSGLSILRIERRAMTFNSDLQTARTNARSAIELGLADLNNDSDWRTNYTNGVETTPLSLGDSDGGTVSWVVEDSDGSLTDADTKLSLKGVGRVGDTVHVASIEIYAVPEVIDALQASVYSVGDMQQNSNSTTTTGPFASRGEFTINGTINGDVEGNPVTGSGTVTGTITDPGPVRGMPSASSWNTYTSLATTIPYTSIPQTNPTTREIDRTLLGVASNPYGSVSSEGVYLIQVPANQNLYIGDSRLHCTLLIELEDNATFETYGSLLWDAPAGKNYPCGVVKGDTTCNVILSGSTTPLREKTTPKINLNPGSDPYEGTWNSHTNDEFNQNIRGLLHVIGSQVHAELKSNFEFTGVIVSEGTVQLGSNVTVNLNPVIFDNPPMGYSQDSGQVIALPGTWIWAAAPSAEVDDDPEPLP